MILGMYRIMGVAALLIGMTASMQDSSDHENYSALKAINLYSICLPVCSLLYDAQLPQIISRHEKWFYKYCKFIFVILYWIFIAYVAIITLKEPWKTVIIYKKVMKDQNSTA